jgi:surfactin synthase thioesterase subunit
MTTTSEATGAWLRTYVAAPDAAVRLVCLVHAGGSASFWLPAARALAPRAEVVAIQYPGRQDRRHEPCIADLPELARQIHGPLAGLPEKPTALLGHSMGAVLAFEIATLMEAHRPATHLFVSGRRAPSVLRSEVLHLLDDDGLIAEVSQLGGTNSSILQDEELMRMALPAIRNDYRAAETYNWTAGKLLSCPITAFVGDEDPKASVVEVAAWARHTTATFAMQVLAGGHFFLVENSSAVLETVADMLARS